MDEFFKFLILISLFMVVVVAYLSFEYKIEQLEQSLSALQNRIAIIEEARK